MKLNIEAQLIKVDWNNLEENEVIKYLELYYNNNEEDSNRAYHYFDDRITSQIVSSENFGSLRELLSTEGLVFIVPVLLNLLSHPDFNYQRPVIDNLNQIAQNIDSKFVDSIEPYHSRANRIMHTMKLSLPVFRKILDESTNNYTILIIEELIQAIDRHINKMS